MTIKFNKFTPSMVNFTDLEENKRSKGQKIAYVRYGDKQPFLQTPEIQLETYGIPRAGEYYKEDSQRSFIKVPLNEEFSTDVKTFKQKLEELDTIMDSDSMREKIFGSKKSAKGWVYQPLVRESMQQTIEDSDSDSDGEDTKASTSAQFRPPYFKAKLKTNYESGAVETVVYKKENGDRLKQKVKTLTELESLVTYRSTIRLVVMPNKLWAMKNMQGKKYGLALKITHLEVEPITRSSMKEYVEGDAFLDSDDEGNESDEDWDIDEAQARAQKASDTLFTSTVREMILAGDRNGSAVESLIMEVNCYKLSENRSFRDAAPAALEAVVELAFAGREGKGACAQGLVKAIARWKPLLAKLLSSGAAADERFAVDALEELSTTRPPLNEPDVFALALQKLYEHDVLSDEGILAWGAASASPLRNSPQVGALLAFLEDDDEDESSEEGSD